MINNVLLKKYINDNVDYCSSFYIENISSGMAWDVYLIEIKNKKIIIKVAIHKDPILLKRMKIEYDIQNYLFNYFPVAKPISYSYDNSIMGNPFYILNFVEGKSKNDYQSIIKSYELLSKLHIMPLKIYSNKIINNYLNISIQKSYNQYQLFKNNVDLDIENIKEYLLNNIPKEKLFSFTHNDWKTDNILFLNKNICAVLDWELFEIGDPRLDLAISLEWLPDNQIQFKDIFMQKYLHINKIDLSQKDFSFFQILAKLRIIVCLQAARIKYENGIIKNNKFKYANDIINLKQQELLDYVK